MRAINHALTGAIIGLAVGEPLIAVPASLVSHYICDVIPHYGADLSKTEEVGSQTFRLLLYADAALCAGLVLLLAVKQPIHWQLAAICAFVAASPDLASLGQYVRITRAHKTWQPGAYVKFAVGIQWFERPIGAVVEAAWFVGAIVLLAPFLR